MATLAEKRIYLQNQYPNSFSWQQRVSKMREAQVHAIYKTMKQREMDLNSKVKKVQGPVKEQPHQMTIFECFDLKED